MIWYLVQQCARSFSVTHETASLFCIALHCFINGADNKLVHGFPLLQSMGSNDFFLTFGDPDPKKYRYCEPPMNKLTCFLMRLAPQATVGSRTWSPNDKPYPLARSPFRIIPATGQVPYSMCTAEHCTQQSSPAGLPASTQCMPSALSASAGLHRHMWFYAALQELLPPVQTAPLPERVLIFPGSGRLLKIHGAGKVRSTSDRPQ